MFAFVNFHNFQIQPFLDGCVAIATLIALGAGLYWFFERRLGKPRAVLTHDVQIMPLDSKHYYVGVTAILKNLGHVQIVPKVDPNYPSAVVIEELLPYLATQQESQQLSPEYHLKRLGLRTFPSRISIEPGESHQVLFEFLVPRRTKAIKIYSYVTNGAMKDAVWSYTTVMEVGDGKR